MTKLSVNINKIATIRNARGGDIPNVVQFALDCEKYGAQGITVHPRPDERHIRYQDCRDLAPLVTTEFNIEGNPVSSFVDLVLETSPNQVTLVPDAEDVLTSNAGWDTVQYQSFLKDVITTCKEKGIRTSIFIDTNAKKIEAAASTGADRIELYTESYATAFAKGNYDYVNEFATAAEIAHQNGLGVNAGHDLSLDNIRHFKQNVPHLLEVSIGHSLISEALYLGISNTILGYLNRLES